MPPCQSCQNPTLCTERCQAYAEQLRICAASGQMEVEEIREHRDAGQMPALSMSMFASKADYDAAVAQVSAHVEAGEMPKPGPGEADCRMCDGRGVYGIPGARCSFCKGIGRVQFWRPRDDAAPKGEAGEMEAAKGDQQ